MLAAEGAQGDASTGDTTGKEIERVLAEVWSVLEGTWRENPEYFGYMVSGSVGLTFSIYSMATGFGKTVGNAMSGRIAQVRWAGGKGGGGIMTSSFPRRAPCRGVDGGSDVTWQVGRWQVCREEAGTGPGLGADPPCLYMCLPEEWKLEL